MATLLEWAYPYYGVTLIALCAFALSIGSLRLRGTAGALLVNWMLCTLAVAVFREESPVVAYLLFDWLAAVAVLMLWGRPNRWQIAVGAVYAFQLVCHAAAAIIATPAADLSEWYALAASAWVQAAILLSWSAYALAGRLSVSLRSRGRGAPVLDGAGGAASGQTLGDDRC